MSYQFTSVTQIFGLHFENIPILDSQMSSIISSSFYFSVVIFFPLFHCTKHLVGLYLIFVYSNAWQIKCCIFPCWKMKNYWYGKVKQCEPERANIFAQNDIREFKRLFRQSFHLTDVMACIKAKYIRHNWKSWIYCYLFRWTFYVKFKITIS